jgi:hypothetical protein
MAVIEVAIGPGSAPGMFRVEVVASPAGEASAAVGLDTDALLARRGLLQQAVLASAVPSRRVLPETEQPVREVGQVLFAGLLGTGEVAGRYRAAAAVATYTRKAGVRHLFAAYELGEDKMYGHIKPRKTRARFLEFCRYLRSLYPTTVRIAIICDNFSPHLTTRKDARVCTWAKASNVEIAYTPTNSSWLNRIPVNRPSARRHARAV